MTDRIALHELLDRTAIILDQFDRHIADTTELSNHPELARKADKISFLLAELYQDIGQERFKDDP